MRDVYLWPGAGARPPRLVWLGPSPTAAFWDECWTSSTLENAVNDARTHPVLLDAFLRHSKPGERVLEAGCGIGQWVVVLAAYGRAVVGVDFATETLCATNALLRPAPLRLGAADVRRLPFPDSAFDTYISLGVAEHFIAGPHAVLDEARRVIAPGGNLVLSVPHFNPLRQARAKLGGFGRLSATPHAQRFFQFGFGPEEFTSIVSECGFEIIERIPFAARVGLIHDFSFASSLYRVLRRAPLSSSPGSMRERHMRTQGETPGQADEGPSTVTPLGGLARWALGTRAVRQLAGHMMLYVARRRAGLRASGNGDPAGPQGRSGDAPAPVGPAAGMWAS